MTYADSSLKDYLSEAAAKQPAPGGGSVSALCGALAASMSEMSANFTTGKEKYASVQDEITEALGKLKDRREKLLRLVDEDATAYRAVSEAYSMPRDTEEEKRRRKAAIQDALKGAMDVPLRIMRHCAEISRIAHRLVNVANPNLLTDVGVSAVLAEAACAAARFNVEINLGLIKDEGATGGVTEEIDRLSGVASRLRAEVEAAVSEHLAE